MSAAVWLVASFAVVLLWTDFRDQQEGQAIRLIESSAEQSSLRLNDFVSARIFVLASLASTYSSGREIEESGFRRSADAVHQQFDGILAVNWVAPDSTIKWTLPVDPNRAARGRKLEDHSTAAPYYLAARTTTDPRMTHPLELFQGGQGVAIYFPVAIDGQHVGTVNGVFRVDQLLTSGLRGGVLENYAVQLADGDQRFYEDKAFPNLAASHYVATREIRLLDRNWTLRVTPRTELWNTIRRPHHHILLAGLLCSLLLALMAYFVLERQRQRYESLRLKRHAENREQRMEKHEALGRLARGITHDFNNLLTAVGTSAELIELDETLTPMGKSNIEAIRTASDRATELTRQLMIFGNPDAVVELSPTLLSGVSDPWQEFLATVVPVDVEFCFDPAPAVSVTMDESSLLRVLTNLVMNAVDAVSERDEAEVSVSWNVGPDTVDMVVSDNGEGMPDDVRLRAFEPYFTTKGKLGTGLGLPTVYGLVKAVGGAIEIDSTPGEGTTITASFPRASRV
jgi:signal transduction histidine kinase